MLKDLNGTDEKEEVSQWARDMASWLIGESNGLSKAEKKKWADDLAAMCEEMYNEAVGEPVH